MPRRRKYESRKGFTLVEMIVVLLILAVVTSMAVPAFSRQIDDAKEKKAVTEDDDFKNLLPQISKDKVSVPMPKSMRKSNDW